MRCVSLPGSGQLLDGSNPNLRTTATFKEIPIAVSTEPWIVGTYEKTPKGVGLDWFFVVKRDLWVNPNKSDDVLKAKFAKASQK